jgi:predicted AlkP superfamily phosphohydrolase/phosphomutase
MRPIPPVHLLRGVLPPGRLFAQSAVAGWALLALFAVLALIPSGCGRQESAGASREPEPAIGRVIVVGFDGLEPTLVRKWAAQGKMPNFKRMIDEGAFGDLVSVLPPASAPAWVSAVTGVNPGKHGVYGFVMSGLPGFEVQAKGGATGGASPVFSTSVHRGFDAVWDGIGRYGRRSVVINVPLTSPADSLNGLMVGGFPHTSADTASYCWPRDLAKRLGDYKFDAFAATCGKGQEAQFIADLDASSDARMRLGQTLFEEGEWDLFWLVFTFTDRCQHHLWKYMDPDHPMYDAASGRLYGIEVENAYRRADRYLGVFFGKMRDSDLVVVMSDHGFGPVYHIMNSQNVLFRALGATPEVMCADFFGGLFKVSAGGPGAEDKYASLRSRLVRELGALRDPETGGAVVDSIYLREEIYSGPYLGQAPDVVCEEKPGYLFFTLSRTPDLRLFDAGPRPDRMFSGYHRRHGVLGLFGKHVRAGLALDARIVDVAPLIYAYLGVPAPAQVDGRVPEAFDEEAAGRMTVARSSVSGFRVPRTDDRQDSKRIEKQLRAVGYVQ